jgi:hypothetical protein
MCIPNSFTNEFSSNTVQLFQDTLHTPLTNLEQHNTTSIKRLPFISWPDHTIFHVSGQSESGIFICHNSGWGMWLAGKIIIVIILESK